MKSLLYIEDDAIARDVLCSLIEAHYPDLKVYSSGTAEEGLDLFKKHLPSIMLTDVNLAGANGVSLARSIRSIATGTVVVFITGRPEIESLVGMNMNGPTHVIIKPVECHALFKLLDSYIST